MSNYFNKVPNFEYVSRLPNAKIGDYIQVKNFFKKGKLREDIFQNLAFFTKYQIVGDDRPDNIALEVYDDSSLDWLVLVCNNIVNIQTEWPMTQQAFDDYVLDKYGNYENLNNIHHYETIEFKNSQGVTIVPAGLQVSENYTVDFYDYFGGGRTLSDNLAVPVTNYEYEEKLENNKRNIFLLKPRYLNVVLDDMDDIMAYKQGSTQYVSETLKRADNIKLYS